MAEEVMEDIIVTARSSAELSSSGGGGGWGGGWGGDAFVFNASDTWGGFFSGYSDLVYEAPILPLPFTIEVLEDNTIVRSEYDFAQKEFNVTVRNPDGSSFTDTHPITPGDWSMLPDMIWPTPGWDA